MLFRMYHHHTSWWQCFFLPPTSYSLYTWSSWKPTLADELGFTFMSMLWGQSWQHIDEFHRNMNNFNPQYILGFNE